MWVTDISHEFISDFSCNPFVETILLHKSGSVSHFVLPFVVLVVQPLCYLC